MLESQSNAKPSFSSWLSKVAAFIGLLLFAYFGSQLLQDNASNRMAKVDEVYEFPVFTKSRSNIINKIDPLLNELNTGQYQKVLPLLSSDSLSEADLFAKIHIYFKLDSLQRAKQLLANTSWNDEYYIQEVKWLEFLIEYRNGLPIEELETKIVNLPTSFQNDARKLLFSK
jgi:hypothetical protein